MIQVPELLAVVDLPIIMGSVGGIVSGGGIAAIVIQMLKQRHEAKQNELQRLDARLTAVEAEHRMCEQRCTDRLTKLIEKERAHCEEQIKRIERRMSAVEREQSEASSLG